MNQIASAFAEKTSLEVVARLDILLKKVPGAQDSLPKATTSKKPELIYVGCENDRANACPGSSHLNPIPESFARKVRKRNGLKARRKTNRAHASLLPTSCSASY